MREISCKLFCRLSFVKNLFRVDFLDTVSDDGSIFEYVDGYYRDDKEKSRYAIQYNKIRNCPKCLGNANKDSFEMLIIGLKNVNWGKKGKGQKFKYLMFRKKSDKN